MDGIKVHSRNPCDTTLVGIADHARVKYLEKLLKSVPTGTEVTLLIEGFSNDTGFLDRLKPLLSGSLAGLTKTREIPIKVKGVRVHQPGDYIVDSPCVDHGFCFPGFSYLNVLGNMPPIEELKKPDWVKNLATWEREKAHKDLVCFLRKRAAEIKPGGELVVGFYSRKKGPMHQWEQVLVQRTFKMHKHDLPTLKTDVGVSALHMWYDRTMDEIKSAIAEAGDEWSQDQLFSRPVKDPELDNWAKAKQMAVSDPVGRAKAKMTYIDHVMKSYSSCNVQSLTTGLRAGTEESLVEAVRRPLDDREKTAITKILHLAKIQLHQLKDEELDFLPECHYFRLRRKQKPPN